MLAKHSEGVIATARAEMSQSCREQQVEEEDWSSFMCSDGTAFSSHEEIILNISDGRMDSSSCNDNDEGGRQQTLSIRCVSALSPLDMIDMYNGSQDATGNRVWTGALLFIEASARMLPMERNVPCVADDEESKNDEPPSSTSAKNDCIATPMLTKLSELRTQAFSNKAIIELGCGTGISGISLVVADKDVPSTVTFTDFDKPALDLCKRNCESNIDDKSRYSIKQLEWGSSLPDGIEGEAFDTVIATDVIYDISSLAPLVHAASNLVKVDGYFILSHVPRASVEGDDEGTESTAVASADTLETLIVAEAEKQGLCIDTLLRPSELSSIWDGKSLNKTSFAIMDSVGSAVLVFRKQRG